LIIETLGGTENYLLMCKRILFAVSIFHLPVLQMSVNCTN